ncbi:MAG: hypothetical protein RLZZ428_1122 [Pseudomonadota bacterium]|jgi:hypothetical protein
MLGKLTPIFILILFAAGAYFMKMGMENAVELTTQKKEIKK